jgi:hypothetical protein
MKKGFLVSKLILVIAVCWCLSNCNKKHDEPTDTSNIVLYNKSLSVIRQCIRGNWELVYAKGGITGNFIQYYHDEYWQFENDNLEIIDSGSVYINTPIEWKYEPLFFAPGQKTYTINYNNRDNVPCVLYVEGIKNDTLTLGDYGLDGFGYHLIKQ